MMRAGPAVEEQKLVATSRAVCAPVQRYVGGSREAVDAWHRNGRHGRNLNERRECCLAGNARRRGVNANGVVHVSTVSDGDGDSVREPDLAAMYKPSSDETRENVM